jgi:two-component system, OmpR family, sensor kinase
MIDRLRLSSIRQKLMLLFFSITAAAILVIYFYVVPQLESSLTSEKLDSLKRNAATYAGPLQDAIGRDVTARYLDSLTRRLSEQTDTGVTLLGIPRNELDSTSSESPPYVISDSREARRKPEPSNAKVLEAARTRSVTTSTRSEGGQRLAQAAKPLFYRGEPAWVVVFSEPLNDVADNVALIKRQILIAGLIALAVALISGYYASSALSKRIRRLERGAGQVAAGNFSDPIPIDSEDELGQLARAFNEMQKRLARLDQARKEFIANASHELRTPIFSLGGFVELLEDGDIDEETRGEFLTTMREQVDRLQKLTTDLLDLSRLDAGSLELELEPVPLRTLAGQVAGEFAAAAAMRGSLIQVVGNGTEPEIEASCDPERVAQILRVLLDNALTHSGEGASVAISAGQDAEVPGDGAAAVLTVTDDGPGIQSADLPHVFDRFHTGNTAQGSGLGLAIAKELAERMLGRLDVTSAPGKTAFQLTLPLVRDRPAQDGEPTAGLPSEPSLSGRA